jgi:hypothetical protein
MGVRSKPIVISVFTVAALMYLAFQGLSLVSAEAAALTTEIHKLDRSLVMNRAIVRDVERYRMEQAREVAALRSIGARMRPDLEAFAARFPPLGIQVERGPTEPKGFYAHNRLVLRGEGKPSLAAAGQALHEAPVLYNDIHVSIDTAGRWSRSGVVMTFVEPSTPHAPPPPRAPRWYSRMNRELWDEVRRKTAEKEALDRQIGTASDSDADVSTLRDVVRVHEALQPGRVDFEPLIERGFTGAQPFLSSGEISRTGTDVVMRGARANPLPTTPDPCCQLLSDDGGDPWVTRWALTTRTATTAP